MLTFKSMWSKTRPILMQKRFSIAVITLIRRHLMYYGLGLIFLSFVKGLCVKTRFLKCRQITGLLWIETTQIQTIAQD